MSFDPRLSKFFDYTCPLAIMVTYVVNHNKAFIYRFQCCEKAFELLQDNGILVIITPGKYKTIQRSGQVEKYGPGR